MPHLCGISESQSNIKVFKHIHTFYFNGLRKGHLWKKQHEPFHLITSETFFEPVSLTESFFKLLDTHMSYNVQCFSDLSWGQHFNKAETFHKYTFSLFFYLFFGLRSFVSLTCQVTQLPWVLDQIEALTFCCTVSGYDLDFICPSVSVSHTGPEAARQIFISNYHFSFFLWLRNENSWS